MTCDSFSKANWDGRAVSEAIAVIMYGTVRLKAYQDISPTPAPPYFGGQ